MTKTLIISHFFNEEFLLPWWLRHHVSLFDHGVLIDYASNDRSIEICRRLAPNWEVRKSRNPEFDAALADEEVMDIEKSFPNWWKLALNTTEFFCTADMAAFIRGIERIGWDAYSIQAMLLIDPPRKIFRYPALDQNESLINQRHHGLLEEEMLAHGLPHLGRCRILHRHQHGDYETGRHFSNTILPYMHPAGAQIRGFLFSPMCAPFVARKLQIQGRVSSRDRIAGRGIHHLVSKRQLMAKWRQQSEFTTDLRMRPCFAEMGPTADDEQRWKQRRAQFLPALGYPYTKGTETPSEMTTKTLVEGITGGGRRPLLVCEGICRNWLARNPIDSEMSNKLALCEYALGNVDSAIQIMSAAVLRNPCPLMEFNLQLLRSDWADSTSRTATGWPRRLARSILPGRPGLASRFRVHSVSETRGFIELGQIQGITNIAIAIRALRVWLAKQGRSVLKRCKSLTHLLQRRDA